jgi:hypothetical protein
MKSLAAKAATLGRHASSARLSGQCCPRYVTKTLLGHPKPIGDYKIPLAGKLSHS